MANKSYRTILTDLGAKKLVEHLQNGTKLTPKWFALGDGDGAEYIPTGEMTSLKKEKARNPVQGIFTSPETPGVITVQAIFENLKDSFVMREMAWFDGEGDMIAICNTPSTALADPMTGAVMGISPSMTLILENAENISLSVDGTIVSITKQEFIEGLKEHDSIPGAHKALFDKKADKKAVEQQLGTKLNTSHANDESAHSGEFVKKADKSYVDTELGKKLQNSHNTSSTAHSTKFNEKADKKDLTPYDTIARLSSPSATNWDSENYLTPWVDYPIDTAIWERSATHPFQYRIIAKAIVQFRGVLTAKGGDIPLNTPIGRVPDIMQPEQRVFITIHMASSPNILRLVISTDKQAVFDVSSGNRTGTALMSAEFAK